MRVYLLMNHDAFLIAIVLDFSAMFVLLMLKHVHTPLWGYDNDGYVKYICVCCYYETNDIIGK